MVKMFYIYPTCVVKTSSAQYFEGRIHDVRPILVSSGTFSFGIID